MQDIFQGKTVAQRRCMGCGFAKNRIEELYTLSLEVRNKTSVLDGLRKMLDGEMIEDFNCDECSKKVTL